MDKAATERDDRSLKNSVKTMPSLSDAWRMPSPALLQQYGKVQHEPEDAPISDGPDIGVRLHTCTHPGLAAATDDLKRWLARRANHSLEMMGWIRQQTETSVTCPALLRFRAVNPSSEDSWPQPWNRERYRVLSVI